VVVVVGRLLGAEVDEVEDGAEADDGDETDGAGDGMEVVVGV
jgi:hypothetical protein